MTHSFLQRLFGQTKRDRDAKAVVGVPTSDVAQEEDLKSVRHPSDVQNCPPMRKSNSLFAFVDPKDPFMAGEIAGEELPGPILSIMSARKFDSLSLFHTPHTRTNALATENEISRRYPESRVTLHELPVSDPKDYSSLIIRLAQHVRQLRRQFPAADNHVCVSSGTAEMRAAWFLLTALGVLPAKLLQVGTPARPLFGQANVKELVDMRNWQVVRDFLMPLRYSLVPAGLPVTRSKRSQREPGEVTAVFGEALAASEPQVELEPLAVPGLEEALQELGIYVGSAILREAAERAYVAADSDLPVLLLGETGTGKECFARLIHNLSPRRRREVVAINCAAIPKEIAEGYLFGYVKGAFTGAISDKKGLFEDADHTTLFLDEIAELTLEVQAKLLRVIQDCAVQRLGSTALRKVDVRIIAATNRDLSKEVTEGHFREDLYFRLEVVQIKLPPLRERRGEIPELALTLLKQINQTRNKPRQLSKAALQRLERCDWAGNVRQLSNVLKRSVLYARSDILDADDLDFAEDARAKDPLAWLPDPVKGFSVEDYVAQVRKQLFLCALAKCNGNQTEAAALLGVSKQAVSRFLSGSVNAS
jgi:DNA-binding NtrC family response regulator